MPFVTPSVYQTDSDGFVPPKFGGSLAIMTGTVEYTDTTAKDLFTLPAGAVMVDFYANVTEAFNDSGTDTLSVGTAASATAILNALDVSSTGVTRFGGAGSLLSALTEETVIKGVYAGQNGDADAGSADFVLVYYTA